MFKERTVTLRHCDKCKNNIEEMTWMCHDIENFKVTGFIDIKLEMYDDDRRG